jgi:hypothetical protein
MARGSTRRGAAFGVDGGDGEGDGGEIGWIAGRIEAVAEGVAVAGLGAARAGREKRDTRRSDGRRGKSKCHVVILVQMF